MKKYSAIKLYGRFLSIHLRSAMQYKASFIMTFLGQFLGSFSAFLGISFMFMRFDSVEGYTYSETLLCFSTILMAFALAECFARGARQISVDDSNGEFDRMLVRPRGEIFQVLTSKIEFSRVGRLLQASLVLAYAIPTCGVEFTPTKVLCLVLMILCGAVLFSGVFVVFAFFCFFTTEGLEFMNIFTDGMREYRKVSARRLRAGYTDVLHLCDSVRARAVLPVSLSHRAGRQSGLPAASSALGAVSRACADTLADRRQTLPLHGFLRAMQTAASARRSFFCAIVSAVCIRSVFADAHARY